MNQERRNSNGVWHGLRGCAIGDAVVAVVVVLVAVEVVVGLYG